MSQPMSEEEQSFAYGMFEVHDDLQVLASYALHADLITKAQFDDFADAWDTFKNVSATNLMEKLGMDE